MFRLSLLVIGVATAAAVAVAPATESSSVMRINHTLTDSNGKRGLRSNAVEKTTEKRNEYFEPNLRTVELILGSMSDGEGKGECGRDAGVLIEAIKQKQKWAMQLFDASPKFPVGILYGAQYQLGNFDECISAKQPLQTKDENSKPITGKYCLAEISLKNPSNRYARYTVTANQIENRAKFNSTLHWAICIPSSCSHDNAKEFLENVFELAVGEESVTISVDESNCYDPNAYKPLTAAEITYGTILAFFLTFVAMSTLYHYIQLRKRRKIAIPQPESQEQTTKTTKTMTYELIVCFSVIRNVSKIFSFTHNELNLDCVSGVKVLSMTFILCGHGLLFFISGPVLNTDFFENASLKVENGIFLNNPLLVDTFLLLSGFLMCRLLLLELEKRKGKINFLVIYVARYIRLTPAYAIVIGFYCTFFIRLSSGPLWIPKLTMEKERCLQSWWSNLLYINNYVNTDYLCMFQSWYLAVDTQLFMIAPIIVYPLWKWKKIGEYLLGATIAVTVLLPFAFTYINQLDPTLLIYPPEVVDLNQNTYFMSAYIKTHMRASSYFLGLLFGYIIHKLQFSDTKISAKAKLVGWIVAAACAVFSMFTVVVFYSPEHEYSVWESSVYGSLHRVAWCLAIGWVLFCCITDIAAFVNYCLTLKIFFPLSRLTYCAYLVNGLVLIYGYGTLRDPIFMSVPNLLSLSISQIMITFIFAFVLCVLFESPIIGLQSILLKKDKRKEESG